MLSQGFGVNDLIESNFRKCRSSFQAGDLECAGLPHKLRVEISNDCNLFCTLSNAYKKHGGCEQWNAKKKIEHMSFDLFKRIVDELGPYATEFWPYNYGEPFMNPQACEMLAYARSKNPTMLMEVHSNGHFFPDADRCRKVMESGLDRLSVSIDGLTQETYVEYRLNGDLNKALKGIEGVCEQKRKLGLTKPEIIFQYIVFDHNIDEVPRVEKVARSLGVDTVNIKINLPQVEREVARRYPEIAKTLSHDSESNYAKTNVPQGLSFCDFPWTHMTILADGRVVVCCRDSLLEKILGNLSTHSLQEVWNGPEYKEYRRQYLFDRVAPGVCARCPCAPQERPVQFVRPPANGTKVNGVKTNGAKVNGAAGGFRLRYLLSPEYVASRTKDIHSSKDLLARIANIFRYIYGRIEAVIYWMRGMPNGLRAKAERLYYETRGSLNRVAAAGGNRERRAEATARAVSEANQPFKLRHLLSPAYVVRRLREMTSKEEFLRRVKNVFLYAYYQLDAIEMRLRRQRGTQRPAADDPAPPFAKVATAPAPAPAPAPDPEPKAQAFTPHPRAQVVALDGKSYRSSGPLRLVRAQAFERQRVLNQMFANARPYKHIVLDGLFDPAFCRRLIDEFPPFDAEKFRNEHGHVGKAHHEKVSELGRSYRELDQLIQSPEFRNLLSGITGIPDLLYDPEYFGGGTHENLETMELDPHVDFTLHPHSGLYRRVNLLLYLNPEWEEAWGGALELHLNPWAPPHENPIQTVVPAFNRCVIFETSDHSWHGFEAIRLPSDKKGLSRRSFALYLYTRNEPRGIKTIPSDLTVFVDRPLPPELHAGRKLVEKDMDKLRHLIVRRDWKLKYLYDRAIDLFNELQASKNRNRRKGDGAP